MGISIPAWVFLSITVFLLFMMVFVSTGSIDDIRMRENYSHEEDLYSNTEPRYNKSSKPSWAKTPEDIFIEEKKSLN